MNSIVINYNQIEWETAKAYLIKVPGTKWRFWFPKGLTSTAGKRIRLLILSDFDFKLFKTSNSKYSRNKIIAEQRADAEEILELFGVQLENEDLDMEDLYDKE